MSRFPRLRRRPDHWTSAHERARVRAAERLDGPLGLAESTWLDEHLAACADCSAIAAAYDADRLALRALRGDVPEPPRDLWARTAAAIEAESASRGRSTAPVRGNARRIPVGALSGIAVIAVVVGVSAVSSGLLGAGGDGGASIARTPTESAATGVAAEGATGFDGSAGLQGPEALPTPLAVGAGSVQWVRKDADGAVAYNSVPVREVCPIDGAVDCAPLDDLADARIAMIANPKSIIGSPDLEQAVVVAEDEAGGQRIVVVTLPTDPVTARPTSSPTPAPTDPAATPEPSDAAPSPTVIASADPVVPSEEPSPTEPVASASPDATPVVTPEPTIAAGLAIAQGISLVGESAAFTADGEWFAFTAAPLDGSSGPDVYLWHVGDDAARRLTTDGRSTFASWDGSTALVSRVQAGGDTSGGGEIALGTETVGIDPQSGEERAAGSWWRPIVDPGGDHAVAWVGTVSPTSDPGVNVPADGRLELRSWPSSDDGGDAVQVVVEGVAADFDVRWDETGDWFAIWIGDPAGSSVGRLSLFRVDPATGLLAQPDGAPVDVAALAGFSIGQGRLAWATPPGQDGEGSRVQVVAWSDDAVGTVETVPGEDVVVVR